MLDKHPFKFVQWYNFNQYYDSWVTDFSGAYIGSS